MNHEIFEGFMKAKSPISHGSTDKRGGNDVPFKRRVWNIQDRVEVPSISGNTIRNGGLRRFLMADMMDQLDYKLGSKTILQFLFAGGILEGVASKDSGALNLQLRQELRKTIPPLALLGGTLGNQGFDGSLDVAMPKTVCEELKDFLPPLPPEHKLKPSAEYLSWDEATTHDPMRSGMITKYLKNTAEDEKEKTVQTIFNWEVLNPGTLFTIGFDLKTKDELIRSCFIRALNLWKNYPVVGGKMGTGHGRVEIILDYDMDDENKYLDFLHTEKDTIISLLDRLCKEWTP